MKTRLFVFALTTLLLLASPYALATDQALVDFIPTKTQQQLTIKQASYLSDNQHQLSPQDALIAPGYLPLQSQEPASLFRGNPATLWVKLRIHNSTRDNISFYLRSGANIYADIYQVKGEQLQLLTRLSDQQFSSNNDELRIKLTTYFALTDEQTLQLLIKFRPRQIVHPVFEIIRSDEYAQHITRELVVIGAFVFILLTLGGVNSTHFIVLRKPSQLIYSFYLLFSVLGTSCLTGIALPLLWPEAPYLDDNITVAALYGNMLTAFLFMVYFFEINTGPNKKLYASCLLGAAVLLLAALISLIDPTLTNQARLPASVITACLCLFSGWYYWRQGNPSAKYYFLAWLILVSTLVTLVISYKLGSTPPYLLEILFFSLALESSMIFLALSHQIKAVKRSEEEQKQQLLISQQEKLLETQRLLEIEKSRASLARDYKLELERHASVCHDMYQPIQAMRMTLEAQQNTQGSNRYTDDIQSIISYLDTLLKEILEETRAKHSRQHSALSISDLFQEAARFHASTAREKHIQIRCLNTRRQVNTSHVALQRIISNLVGNAVAHTREAKVLIGLRNKPDSLCVQVIDTGEGFDISTKDKLLQPFYSTSDKTNSYGLGLAIVQMLCNEMGYTLDITSERGKGTCVSVCLPKTTLS